LDLNLDKMEKENQNFNTQIKNNFESNIKYFEDKEEKDDDVSIIELYTSHNEAP